MTKFVTHNGIRLALGLLTLVVFSAACAAKEEPAATPKPAATQAPVTRATPTPVPTLAPAPTVAPAQVRPTHWTWALANNPTVNLDPLQPGLSAGARTVMFENLITEGGPVLQIEKFLAEDWRFVTPTHVRFSLRKNAKFHNGDPFTAEDAKYTWERATKDAKIPWGLRMAPELQALEVVDPYTFDVKFKREFGPVMTELRSGLMTPKAYRERVGPEAFKKSPVGTGPYKLATNQVDQRVDLEANKDYYLGPVFPPKLSFIWIREATTRTAAVLAGTVDASDGIAHEELARLEKEPGLEVILTGLQKSTIHINYGEPPMNNESLRKALNYAVDKQAIVNDLFEGRAAILAGHYQQGAMGYDPDLKPYPYDPNKARALIKEAGMAGLSFEFTSLSGIKPMDREVSQLLLSYWEAVGLKPRLKFITREQYWENRDTLTFTISNCCLWSPKLEMSGDIDWDFLAPGYRANRRLDSFDPLGKQLREMWDRQVSTTDFEARDKIMREMNHFIYNHALTVFHHESNVYAAASRKLGWQMYPKSSLNSYHYYDHWNTIGQKPVPIFRTR